MPNGEAAPCQNAERVIQSCWSFFEACCGRTCSGRDGFGRAVASPVARSASDSLSLPLPARSSRNDSCSGYSVTKAYTRFQICPTVADELLSPAQDTYEIGVWWKRAHAELSPAVGASVSGPSVVKSLNVKASLCSCCGGSVAFGSWVSASARLRIGRLLSVSDTTRISYVVFHGSGSLTGGRYLDDSESDVDVDVDFDGDFALLLFDVASTAAATAAIEFSFPRMAVNRANEANDERWEEVARWNCDCDCGYSFPPVRSANDARLLDLED